MAAELFFNQTNILNKIGKIILPIVGWEWMVGSACCMVRGNGWIRGGHKHHYIAEQLLLRGCSLGRNAF